MNDLYELITHIGVCIYSIVLGSCHKPYSYWISFVQEAEVM